MFAQRYPDIEIAVETGARPVDLKREPIDLAIRHGLGKYPGLEATWLVAPELIVVASPELLKNRAPLKRPADCLAFPLLMTSIARTGRFGLKPMASPRRTAKRARRFRRIT